MSQNKKIKALLENGYRVTDITVWLDPEIKCRRLASRICDLRESGMNIITEMVGNPRHAEYYLKDQMEIFV